MSKVKLGNKIKKILKIDKETFSLFLEFEDGFKGKLSCEHIFSVPKGLAAEVLRGDFFNKCFIENGALAWPNGLELCPDSIRMLIVEKAGPFKRKSVA